MNIAKFLRAPILKNNCEWLFLQIDEIICETLFIKKYPQCITRYPLHEKCPNLEFFSGLHFPVFGLNTAIYGVQFVIFKPWKVPWNWIAFYQDFFVISHGLLYHLIRGNTRRLPNEAFTSNLIVSSKQ